METESPADVQFSGNRPRDGAGLARINPELLARLPLPPLQCDDDQANVVIGSEEWHSEIPAVCVSSFVKRQNI